LYTNVEFRAKKGYPYGIIITSIITKRFLICSIPRFGKHYHADEWLWLFTYVFRVFVPELKMLEAVFGPLQGHFVFMVLYKGSVLKRGD